MKCARIDAGAGHAEVVTVPTVGEGVEQGIHKKEVPGGSRGGPGGSAGAMWISDCGLGSFGNPTAARRLGRGWRGKQVFLDGASAVEDDGCDFQGRKNHAQTMPFSYPFRAFFVPGWCRGRGLGCLGGGLTRDCHARADRALTVADGKESGRPHGRTPRFVVSGA